MQLKIMIRLLLVLWVFVPVAQAFYNPATGCWLNRDPMGGRWLIGLGIEFGHP